MVSSVLNALPPAEIILRVLVHWRGSLDSFGFPTALTRVTDADATAANGFQRTHRLDQTSASIAVRQTLGMKKGTTQMRAHWRGLETRD